MISITDIFKLIPDILKQTAVDAIVETMVERKERLLSDSVLDKIKGLRSDTASRRRFSAGLQRFLVYFQLQDKNLAVGVKPSNNMNDWGWSQICRTSSHFKDSLHNRRGSK